MKTFLTKSKSSFALILFVSSLAAWSKPVAQVKAITGQVFVVSPEGITKSLKIDERIEEKSEIMVGEGATITLNDYYDASYTLISGSHLKFFDKAVLLKKGKSWTQSMNSRHPLSLTTANGHVDYMKGEFITTFDQTTSRSQVLVVNGEVEVSNVLEKNMKYTVPAGTFTFIDPEVESGIPRAPTKVGMTSLNNAVAEFKGISHTPESSTAPARAIASVVEAAPSPVKKGEIIIWSSKRAPASVSAHDYLKKKTVSHKVKLTNAPISFFGLQPAVEPKQQTEHVRHPASFMPLSAPQTAKKIGSDLNIDAEFSDSLRQETVQQPKYSKELENLIQDLKSY